MIELYDYMSWGNYDQRIRDLATMAIDEKWNFENATNNGILKNYMRHTFNKLYQNGGIIENDQYCLFNTGLFTDYYEAIYAYGKVVKNDSPDKVFKGFMTGYDLGNIGIKTLPERADYFQDPTLLIFDYHCNVNVQYKHILEDTDNKNRLPAEIKNSQSPIMVLRGMIETAIKRVQANYRLAVPQYFNDTIQLLIPLYYTDAAKPDLALVLTKHPEGYYQGHTCITMEMAYNNARLIAKPESNWLVP